MDELFVEMFERSVACHYDIVARRKREGNFACRFERSHNLVALKVIDRNLRRRQPAYIKFSTGRGNNYTAIVGNHIINRAKELHPSVELFVILFVSAYKHLAVGSAYILEGIRADNRGVDDSQ